MLIRYPNVQEIQPPVVQKTPTHSEQQSGRLSTIIRELFLRQTQQKLKTVPNNSSIAETTPAAIDELLEGAFDDGDGSEARYKLRSARQLLQVVQERQDIAAEAIDTAAEDEDILKNIR